MLHSCSFGVCVNYFFLQTWRLNVLGKINSPAVQFLNRLQVKADALELKAQHPFSQSAYYNVGGVSLPVLLMKVNCIKALLPLYTYVDTHGKDAKASLVIDHFNVTRNKPNTLLVATIDVEMVKECLLQYLA